MDGSIIIGLLQNIAILMAFALLYENIWLYNGNSGRLTAKIFTGIILGGIGIVLMHTPWKMSSGLLFDTRSVMLAVSALFFGTVPTLIAIVITATMRFIMGGPGVWMGIGVIMSAGLIGIFWAHDSLKRKRKNRAVHFLLLGLIVHVTMLGCTVLLPDNQFIPTLRMIVLPVLLIYIPGTMMLGMLLEAQRQNAQNRKEKQRLYEMEHKLSSDLLEKQQELHDLIEKYKLLTIDYQQQNVELKISKEKAEEGERLKSAFLDNISHEIRTPMNAIMGFTDLLDVDGLSREKRVQYVEIIRQSGKYLLSVINDIVEISHIETGLVEINRSEIDPDVMLQEIFSTCNVLFPKSKDIKFKIETATGFVPGKLVCDAVKLRQVLINLVNNALKFTDQGEICLGYYFHDVDRISFFVRDTGIGIAEENQKIIFERFRQVGAGRSNSRGGSGLGLSITKSYVEMMGGVIEVQSTLGAGSRFIVTLPCQPGPEPVAMPQSVPVDPAPEVPGHPMEVLVAEDEEVSWFFIKQVLSKQKMKVIRAKDGREAVELCKKHQGIDVVLMDINMPEMNGYEALAEIRKLNPGLPVIAQTAYALSEDLKRLKDSFYDYVTKPIDRKLLLEKILAATGRS